MTTYTWIGGVSEWQVAGNWSPSGGPPGAADIAQADTPSTIMGSGTATQFQSTNGSGLVTLDGTFNLGTIFNGAEMSLQGNITSQFIETFVSLTITGAVAATASLNVPDNGILQGNGAVVIENGGTVDASSYTMNYNPGSLDQPNESSLTINGNATLVIATQATVDASNQITGGFGMLTAGTVDVENGGSLSTTYLSLEDADAQMNVEDSTLRVVQTSSDPNGVAGINISAGTLAVTDGGDLASTFFYQNGTDAALVIDNSSATITASDDDINGIDVLAGGVFFNDSNVSASQLHLEADPSGSDEPFMRIINSSLEITGTGSVEGLSFSGLWLAAGTTDIDTSSHVITPTFELDSPTIDDPANTVNAAVTLESASTLSVAGNAILGVTDSSSVELDVTGSDTELLWGDQLIVGDGSGDGTGATATLSISSGAGVKVSDDPDATGLLAIGGHTGDNGDIDVADDGSTLGANDAIVGFSGDGTLFATNGGSIDVSGTLTLGLDANASGTLLVAGEDGPGDVTVGTLEVGSSGDGTVHLSSLNGLNSGALTVEGNAYVGVFDGGSGTITGAGGSLSIGGEFIVGAAGTGVVDLDSTDLTIDGDWIIGGGGPVGSVTLQAVDLTLGGTLVVGADGNGSLDWGSNADQATTIDSVIIGADTDSDGEFVLHDPTVLLTIGSLAVGGNGAGTLDVFNGAAIEVTGSAVIGAGDGSSGTIELSGGVDSLDNDYPNAGSSITFDGTVFVGGEGAGSLLIGSDGRSGDGAFATVHGDLIIGADATSSGTVAVANDYVNSGGTTVASVLTVDQNIDVGVGSTGTLDFDGTVEPDALLNILNGATVDATADGFGAVSVGLDADGTGGIDVNGGWLNANTLVVGAAGDGSLLIDFGTVVVSGTVIAGDSADSTGTLDVTDGSLLHSDGVLAIGGGATAIINAGTVEYPAILNATSAAVIESTGTGEDDGFFIGLDEHSLGEAIINAATLDVTTAVIGDDGSGVLEIINGGTATFHDDLTLGNGTASFGGMDVSDSDVDFYGTLDVGEDATGATVSGTFIPGALLTIENGAKLLDQGEDGIDIAVNEGSTGQMIVDDADAEPTAVIVGDNGAGTLTVRNDGSLFVDPDQDVEIASGPSSSGTVTVDGGILSYGSELDVGSGGSGSLSITNSGTVGPDADSEDTDVTIGDDVTATGAVTVDDSLLLTDDIYIGNKGGGTLTVQNGGTVDTAGDAVIAAQGSVLGNPAASGSGTVTLTGLGGTVDDTLWKIDGQLSVGDFGKGSLAVNDGATLTVADEFDIGDESEGIGFTGTGTVSAFGTNSLIKADAALFIGGDGRGTVALAGNAQLLADDDVTLGDGINSAGSLMISGATFESTGSGDIVLGEQGTGFVQVAFGGDFNAGTSDVILGDTDLGKGTLNLVTVGTGNPTAETGDLTVGEEGTGSVSVMGNGLITTDGDAVIGDTGDGTVVINGVSASGTLDPATWSISGDLSIGGLTTAGGGVGTLTVSNNGIVQVAGELVMWNLGTIIDNSATAGVIEIGGTTLTSGSGIVIDAAIAATSTTTATAQGTLSGGGTILSNIVDNGLVDLTNGQTLVIDGSISGTGTLLLDGTAVLEVQGGIASTVKIDFDSGAGQTDVLELGTPLAVKGTIFNLGSTDGIDLAGVKFAGTSFNVTNDVLTVTNGGNTIAALALGGATYSASAFSLIEDGSGNAEIVFENPVPPPSAPTLVMPAELPSWPLSAQEYLTSTAGIYVADPNAPVNSTYTLTVNDQTGTLFVLYGDTTTQTDSAGSSPIKFTGSLAQINADLQHLIYQSGGSAFAGVQAPPDTITATLVRGDGVTVTGASGYDPPISDASIINSGPTTVALGQTVALSFVPGDPYASYSGDDVFGIQLNTDGNNGNAPFNGYLLIGGQLPSFAEIQNNAGVTTFYEGSDDPSLAGVANELSGGNLLFVPTATGTVPIDGTFTDGGTSGNNPAATANFSFGITVTAATRTTAVTDTWTGLASSLLSTAGNWNHLFATGTIDTALFAPIAGTPVIATTGDGVAAAWDIDTSTSFAGVVDATGRTSGAAFDVDKGATATFLPGSALFAASLFNGSLDGEEIAAVRGNPIIVGDTTRSALIMTDANLTTGEATIGNNAGAGGSQMTLTNVFWAVDGNASTGNPGDVLVGNNGYGILTLIDSEVDNVEAQNYQAAGYGQIQIGQNYPGANMPGGLGVFFNAFVRDSVQVGFYGEAELAMGGGSLGNAINIQSVSLSIQGGRVDWGGGATLYITNGLAGSDPASIEGGVLAGDDWTIATQGSGTRLTNDGTIEAAAGGGGASTVTGVAINGSGTILLDAGATLDLNASSVSSGQTIVFQTEFDGAGGLLEIGDPGSFGATINGFADGDRIAMPTSASNASIVSATYDSANDTTAVGFSFTQGNSTSSATITFGGSLSVGNFARESSGTVFDYVRAGASVQPPVLSGPSDIAATDGVVNAFPGLSLSDFSAVGTNQKITLTLTSQTGPSGTFSAPAAAGLTITGEGTDVITLTGALAVLQAELPEIGFTPFPGIDDYIQVTASDGAAQAAPIEILAHNSAVAGTPQFTGTDNYIYTGPATGSFDTPGVWTDSFGNQLLSGPGIADSATIISNPLHGSQVAVGGIGVAGQLLTEGLVVLTGSLTLAGLSSKGVGTVVGTGPAFVGALEAGPGNLILASSARLSLGGDLIVTGALDSIADNPWSVDGNIDINGGTLALGGLGGLTATGTVNMTQGGTLEVLGNPSAAAGAPAILTSAAAIIGTGAGTSVVNVEIEGVGSVASTGASGWVIGGTLVVGASGAAEMTIQGADASFSGASTTAKTVSVGLSASASGTLTVLSLGGLEASANLTVGGAGSGSLVVGYGTSNDGEFGGQVSVGSAGSPGEFDIGALAGGVGNVLISEGGTISVSGAAYLGGTSAGASGGTGTVTVTGDTFFPSIGSLLDVTGGFTAYSGTVLLREGIAALGSLTIEAGATLTGDGSVNGPGVPTGNFSNPTSFTTSAPLTTIVDNGMIDANPNPASGAATLLLYGSVSGTGTLEVAAGATLDIEGSVAASLHVVFAGPGAELILSQPASFGPVISGFQAGDEIRLAGIAPGTVAYNPSTGLLTDTVNGTVYSFTFDPPSGSFTAVSDLHDGTLLELTSGPAISAPATATVGVGQSEQITGVSLAGSSTETGDTFTVTLSDGNGLLSATGTGVSGSGGKSLTINGALSSVNAALLTLHDTDTVTPSDTITLNATDVTQSKTAPTETIAVTVNAVPVITAPASATVTQNTATTIAGVSVAETGNTTTSGETFTAALTDTNGLLSASDAGGATVSGSGTRSLTLSGSLTQVNTALATLADADAATAADTITVNASDSFGNVATPAKSIPVTVTSASGSLAITAPAAATVGVGQTDPVSGISLSETPTVSGETFTATLADTNGLLSASDAGGATVTGSGTKSLTIGGSLSQVNAALATLTDQDGTAVSDTIAVNATDSNGGSTGPSSIAVTVNAIPVIAAPASATVTQNTATTIAGVSVAETGNTTTSGETFTATLTDTNGLLSASDAGGATVSGSGTRSLTIGGSLTQVNTALATLADADAATAADTITVNASDSFGNTATPAKSIPVTATSASGSLAITAPAAATVGVGQTDPVTGISLAESPTVSGETFAATLADTNGLLSASDAGGATVTGSGTKSLTIGGSLSQVNAALATLTDQDGTAVSDTIAVNATDSNGGSTGPSAIAVTVNAIPVIAAPASATVTQNTATTIAGVSVAETGNTTTSGETFTAALTDTNGLLSASDAGGATVSGSGTRSLTLSGSLTQVNTALATLADADAATAADTITVNASDSLGNAATPAKSIPVTVTSASGSLAITAPAAATVGVGQTDPVSGISLSETPTVAGETFTATLADTNGLLSASSAGGATVTGSGTKSLTIGGSLSQVNAALATLTDQDGTAVSDTIAVNATDSNGGSTGPSSIAVTVNAIPVIAAPASATVTQNTATTIAGVSVAETGNTTTSGETFTATLTDTNGLLSASDAGGATVSGSGTRSLTIGGSLTQVNTALATLADADAATAADTITVNASDSFGNTATPTKSIPVTVTSASGSLAITAPAAATVGVGQTDPVSGISLSETPTVSGETFAATLADTNGLLSASDAGGATVTGSGTKSLTIGGSLSQVNAALATLTDQDGTAVSDTIAVNATDSNGGSTGPSSIAVTVNAIPVIAAPASATVTQNTATTIAGVSVAETGNTTTSGETFTATLTDTNGLLSASDAGGATVSGSGTRSLTLSGSLTQVNTALATLADADAATAADTITVNASDSFGNTATPAKSIPVTATSASGSLAITAPAAATVGVGQTDPVTGISLAETPTVSGETFAATLADTNGLLSASDAGGATVTGSGTKSLTIGGSLSQVNAALATLTDQDGTAVSDTIAVNATDSNGGSTGPSAIAVTVNAIPVIAAPASATVTQNTATTIAGVSVAETGNTTTSGETFTAALTDTNGLLSASDAGGATVSGSGTRSLTLSGSLTQVNTALATLADADAATAADTITVNASDSLGNAATPAKSIPVTVTSASGSLAITAPAAATVGVGQTDPVSGISLAESPTVSGETFAATLADTTGLLSASDAGGATVTGSGTKSLTIGGSLSQVNAALATLTDQDGTAVSDTIAVNATDSNGGSTGPSSIAVTVNAIPVIAAPASATVTQNTATTIAGVSVAETGNTTTSGETFTAALTDTNGLLSASDAGGATVSGSGTRSLTLSGSLTQVNTALATLADADAATAADTITVNASDSLGNAATPTKSIPVTVTSASGSLAITAPAAATVGVGQTDPVSGISLAESPTVSGETFAATLADTNGLLSASDAGGATVTGSGTKSLTIGGSLSQVNAALATLTDQDGTAVSDTIAVNATDSNGGSTGPSAIAVTVNAIPVIAAPASATVTQNTATTIAGVSVAETGNTTTSGETFTAALTDTNGLLSASDAGGATVSGSGTRSLTLSGSLTQVNTALATLADADAATAADTITVNASDSFGNTATPAKSIPVTVTSASGSLAITAPAAATVGVGQTDPVSGISLSESPTVAGETFAAVLTDTNGVLSANTSAAGCGGTITPSNGGRTLTISGTLAQVNADLTTLTDKDGTTPSDTITVKATDSKGGSAGPTSIAVTVNTAPIITAPASAAVTQNTVTIISGVSVAETGNTTTSGESFTVVVADGNGVLSANASASGGGGTIAASNHGKTLTITGTLAQVNADLTTLADDDATTKADTITVNARDSFGNTATPAKSIPVTVKLASGALAITAPSAATVGVDQTDPVSGISLSESPTVAGETFTAVLTDTNGVLSANTSAAGCGGTITPSNGGRTLTISGTLAQVNADLTTLTDKDGTTPSDTITVKASDSNGGSAGPTSIAVTVNTAPVITAPASATVTQNTATKISGVSVSETGNTTTSGESFTVVVADGNGVLSANTSATGGGGTIAASNHGKTLTISGTLVQVNADLTTLADDDATTAADTITVNAGDGFGNAAIPAKSIPVTVTPEINGTPPTILGTLAGQTTTDEATIKPLSGVTITDTNASASESVTLTLTNSSGAATDANGSLSGTGITKTGTGTYTLTVGSPMAVSSELQALAFTPTAHEVTPGQATTTGITISDYDGSFTTTNKTTSIIAKAVNDAPVITGTLADQTTTDNVPINPFRNAVLTDVDVDVDDSVTITLKSSSGVATDANGLLSGAGLSKTGVGTYTLAATTPAALTTELEALAFTPTQHQVAAGKTVATSFTLTASQTAGGSTVTATNTTTSLAVTALNYIFGPTGGFGLLIGTPGQDVITAYGQFNVIYGEGGPDIINAGSGHANVNVDDGSTTVTLGGGNNVVQGSNGNNAVTGAPGGSTNVSLGNGNNVVQISGNADYIALGNGNNVISGGQGMEFIATGSGNDTVTVGGSGNQVNAGGGTNVINGGTGNDTFVLPPAGLGFDTITGFSELNGDVLDLRSALAATGWNGKSSTLGNYLKVADSNGNTTLAIASNGTGAGTAIAALNGSGSLGLTDLLSHHSLLT